MAVAALALAPMGSLAARSGSGAAAGRFDYAAVAAQVNTIFRTRTESGQQVALTLTKAPRAKPTFLRPGRPMPPDAGHEKFSLIFDGPKELPLASAIHVFEHERLGRVEFYLGEIGPRVVDGIRYHAVFSFPPNLNPTTA